MNWDEWQAEQEERRAENGLSREEWDELNTISHTPDPANSTPRERYWWGVKLKAKAGFLAAALLITAPFWLPIIPWLVLAIVTGFFVALFFKLMKD
jgi:hypothetical protein